MQNWKIVLEYDGTAFSGWQIQPNERTVQEELERSMRQICGIDVRVSGGGRTDAGVHAGGQTASFATEKSFRPSELLRSLNGVLPEDIAVISAEEVDQRFHARYSAVARRYRYTIMRRPTVLLRRQSWEIGWRLDEGLLSQCANMFCGEQDFQSFSKTNTDVEHFRCTVQESRWAMDEDRLEYWVKANRFLYGMVRAMVGTMVEIGRGYRPMDELSKIMAAKDRSQAGMAAPAKGLCLMSIEY
ncbi:MAG: tRNA pseudouridine(38-40) synthase TruA [Ignavibacteria bacterium RIFCSPHIGHO2_02_FULL_56_12]|nr:MAG: tRNA pseudouridine(38-40) synthase TruA [Ignavibacteria bacterium RIFCSPHIGHO2_02_FULL_56_12]